ncbi:hypothetical protein H0B56_16090 [Haloechinothrix sp. YIM 98757]|uniref:Bacteriocin biosynthesis cyclodehydratase domain-containing protein n=1 Tax=Haloechinothrix aidingensis TaxID=2752311 RepID=A0A838ACT0_9PSEU|nr:hypothetical protein [Haloechinothrix aidingensis]MBA0127072.1 hypothetical protein [Haloechinothrix aidingensis]
MTNARHTGSHPARARTRLPSRPRLVPGIGVFRRGGTELQVGLDPRHAVVISGVSSELATVLGALDGTSGLPTLLADLGTADRAQLRRVLTELTERGLVDDAATHHIPHGCPSDTALWGTRASGTRPLDGAALGDRCAHSMMLVHGDGPLCRAVATGLATAGIGHVAVETTGTMATADVTRGDRSGDIGRPRHAAVVDAVRDANPTTDTAPVPSDRYPDLAVLTDAVVPSPELVHRLMSERIPHLPVRVRDGTGIVGPLVVPGRTSCLHCADLHRAERDSGWPWVAGRLAGRPRPAGPVSSHAVAALAVGQAVRSLWSDNEPCPTWNTTLELDVFDGRLRQRSWQPHARCGCRTRR